MSTRHFTLAAIALAIAVLGATGQYHAPVYLTGGDSSSTLYPNRYHGVLIADLRGTTPSLTTLMVHAGSSYSMMDVDNHHVIVGVTFTRTPYLGPNSGLYRLDPTTGRFTTLRGGSPSWMNYCAFFHPETDHNGDYICGVQENKLNPAKDGWKLWKVSRTGQVTTLLQTHNIGVLSMGGVMHRDIDTGHMLIGRQGWSNPPRLNHGILAIDTDTGAVTTWSTGGWYGYRTWAQFPLHYLTETIRGPDEFHIYQLTPGTSSRTTLMTLATPIYGALRFDLQTAEAVRWVGCGADVTSSSMSIHVISEQGVVTSTGITSTVFGTGSFQFYRGRHTQSVRVAPRQWQILLSAPDYPGKRYAAVIGYTGIRPGIPIPGHRRILIRIDPLTILTLEDRLRPIYHPGPGVLDATGRATLRLDLSRLGSRLNIPIWVAWIVLDPKAPGGIAYVPDPYVMRV